MKIITKAEGNPHKFYQKGKILIQQNPVGEWHGYIDCLWKEGFNSKNAALEWFEGQN